MIKEKKEQIDCLTCNKTKRLIVSNFDNIGADVRLDLESNQLKVMLGTTDEDGEFISSEYNGSLRINYCPVCGRKLEDVKRENWEVLCDEFFETHKDVLVVAPGMIDEDPYVRFLWDDYEEAKKKLREINPEEPGFYCYTLIEDDGESYIIPNWHFVNRLGYFVSTVKADENVNVRYW